MSSIDSIRKHIQTRHGIYRNITIIDNCDFVNISGVNKGLLIVYVSWSRKAIENFIATIKTLEYGNYNGKILIVDNDVLNQDFQIQAFGQLCHGWGEIFIIDDGRIIQQFLGKDSFQNFNLYFDKL